MHLWHSQFGRTGKILVYTSSATIWSYIESCSYWGVRIVWSESTLHMRPTFVQRAVMMFIWNKFHNFCKFPLLGKLVSQQSPNCGNGLTNRWTCAQCQCPISFMWLSISSNDCHAGIDKFGHDCTVNNEALLICLLFVCHSVGRLYWPILNFLIQK
jgi:hypothetical protein